MRPDRPPRTDDRSRLRALAAQLRLADRVPHKPLRHDVSGWLVPPEDVGAPLLEGVD